MSYREMETTPPARRWGWVLRRRAVNALWALAVASAALLAAREARKGVREIAADILRREQLAEGARAARAAECIRGGGTWNVGTVDGRPAEWCARGQR